MPEVKDCVKAAALGLEYKQPRPTTEFSIQREVDEAVDKMMVRGGGVGSRTACMGCLGSLMCPLLAGFGHMQLLRSAAWLAGCMCMQQQQKDAQDAFHHRTCHK